jgi:sugar transferase (PEP-CTERM system associated)
MFKVFAHRVRGLTVAEFLADSLACFLAISLASSQLISVHARHDDGTQISAPELLLYATEFALVMSLMYAFVGLYRRGAVAVTPGGLLRRAFIAVFMGTCIAFLAMTAAGGGNYALQMLVPVLSYMAVGVVTVRSLALLARRADLGVRRVLIVGSGAEANDVANDIRTEARAHSAIVGFYPAGAGADVSGSQPGHFSSATPIDQIAREYRVNEIVVAVREQRGGCVPMDQLLACRLQGIEVLSLAGFYERSHGQVPTESLKASWLVYGNGFVQGAIRESVKRAFDVACSLFLLVLALPVMLVAMLAIRLESPGSIIYRQERVGMGGRSFMCLKFRSMRSDAEQDGVARWAAKNDARVTKVGAFMRRARIDELPQLFSVLRGDMSLVGPRPERPCFVKQLREQIPFYDVRHSVKPGVTGWAQVRYGYGATVDDARKKHQFDLYYVKNNSLFLDLLVLIETVSVVLFREGSQ